MLLPVELYCCSRRQVQITIPTIALCHSKAPRYSDRAFCPPNPMQVAVLLFADKLSRIVQQEDSEVVV